MPLFSLPQQVKYCNYSEFLLRHFTLRQIHFSILSAQLICYGELDLIRFIDIQCCCPEIRAGRADALSV